MGHTDFMATTRVSRTGVMKEDVTLFLERIKGRAGRQGYSLSAIHTTSLQYFDANPEPGSDKVGHPPFYLVRRGDAPGRLDRGLHVNSRRGRCSEVLFRQEG